MPSAVFVFIAFVVAVAVNLSAAQPSIANYYTIENIAAPKGLDPQVGGLDFMPDGRLVACFHRGEVYTYHPKTKTWKLFAEGLQEPLGVVANSDREVVIMQRPELTRLTDTDGDGAADVYQTLTDAFGMSGNYHEFAFGPARDAEGNFYIGLNVASNGASVRDEVRGEFRHYGLSRERFKEDWKKVKGLAGRMYSAVPYRGWVLKVAPDGTMTPFAPGFRSPNGLAFDASGDLWVTDNQGDWLGASKLFHVRKDHFHGHPASLVWTKDWQRGDPLKIPVAELDRMRTRAAVMFPQGSMANSPTQPLIDSTGGKFGPFAGQLLIGEMNQPRIMRVMLDKVNGEYQGACVPFYHGAGLRIGNNRFVFDKAGALWVGQEKLSWVGDAGIQRITWNGKTPMDLHTIKVTKAGFDLTFTKPVDAAIAGDVENYALERFYFRYHQKYGSPEHERTKVTITKAVVSNDGKTVSLTLDEVVPWRVYRFNLKLIAAQDGDTVWNPMVVYTLNQLRDATPPPGPETFSGER